MERHDQQIENRLTKLEARTCFMDRVIEDRQLVVAAHSRRLADIESRVHDLTRVQVDDVERLTTISTEQSRITRERREEKIRHEQRQAMLQWAISVAMAAAVVVGFLTRGEIQLITRFLSGFGLHQE